MRKLNSDKLYLFVIVGGQLDMELANGDFITIERSPYSAYFLRMQPENYFYSTLTDKLWRKREL